MVTGSHVCACVLIMGWQQTVKHGTCAGDIQKGASLLDSACSDSPENQSTDSFCGEFYQQVGEKWATPVSVSWVNKSYNYRVVATGVEQTMHLLRAATVLYEIWLLAIRTISNPGTVHHGGQLGTRKRYYRGTNIVCLTTFTSASFSLTDNTLVPLWVEVGWSSKASQALIRVQCGQTLCTLDGSSQVHVS